MNAKVIVTALCLALAPGLFAETVPGRYIVELSGQPVSTYMTNLRGRRANLRGTEAQAQRTRLRGEQDGMRARIE